ncbi:MAG: energy transducer TonB [Bacteroidales bacterium]|nr:energy transducer TonB [Bacteroidales bacterium]
MKLITSQAKEIEFSSIAIEKRMQGKVVLVVYFSSSGIVKEIEILKGINAIMDKEAVRVFKNIVITDYNEGSLDNFETCFTFPFTFKFE